MHMNMKTSTTETLEDLVLRARTITICGIGCPMQFVEIRTYPDLYGAWDNDGHTRCFLIDMLPEIAKLADKHRKKIVYENPPVHITPIIKRLISGGGSYITSAAKQ